MLQREDLRLRRLCQARSQPSDNGRGSRFTQILDLFQGLKKWEFLWLSIGETSIFKIIMRDDVTLWSKFESYGKKVYSILLILFHIQDVSARTDGGKVTF